MNNTLDMPMRRDQIGHYIVLLLADEKASPSEFLDANMLIERIAVRVVEILDSLALNSEKEKIA